MATKPLPFQPSPFQSPLWTLEAAHAQRAAIAAALMPLGVLASGQVPVPAIEIETTAEALVVTAFWPGVEPQQVQVRASRKSLTFSGQRPSGYPTPLGHSLGTVYFQQTVTLPVAVIDHQVQVAYRDGAIVVTLPKPRGWGQRLESVWQQAKASVRRSLKTWSQHLLEDR